MPRRKTPSVTLDPSSAYGMAVEEIGEKGVPDFDFQFAGLGPFGCLLLAQKALYLCSLTWGQVVAPQEGADFDPDSEEAKTWAFIARAAGFVTVACERAGLLEGSEGTPTPEVMPDEP